MLLDRHYKKNDIEDSKSDTVSQGREAVKEVVTQPFNTLDSAKDSLKQSEEKTKAALEQVDKESQ